MEIKKTNKAYQVSQTSDEGETKQTQSASQRTPRGVGDIQNHFEHQNSDATNWLNPLFSNKQQYKQVASNGVQELNQLDQFQRKIMDEFAGLDITKPENTSGRPRSLKKSS